MIMDIKIPENTEDVLKMALEMEEQGYETYIESVKLIQNSLGKRMLKRVAKDELIHMKRIKEVYEALEGKRNWDEMSIAGTSDKETFQDIFNRLREELKQSVEELGSHGVNDEEIIETAINLENHAKFFYSESAKKAPQKKVKKFLEILAAEEESHYQALRKINSFMEDPANWFATQGKFK